ncbi:SRPBCC domain-containing protein [Acidovorax sp. MR-S7]|uniref:SRPBCC domain-containing protein n=1 Tax=Acidovorax sp. MR-S7 TaxID=1268622 RepID=UPI0003651BFA|nr:SRPBCC domain-containing protein [Acidovorax sp. MR-S7]GAD21429.1 hypothetical protein AVS7_01189 [Acidovorax sp. MR-S7]
MPTHRIATEIGTRASPAQVWSVLTDFARYPQWNPFIREAEGEPLPGSRLKIRIQPPGQDGGMVFRPRVLRVEPEREFAWLGHLIVPGLFDGEHYFHIDPLPGGGCRVRQSENFSGLLVPLFRKSLDGGTRQGFEAMNAAWVARAESAS